MKLFGWKPGRVEARPALARAGLVGAAQGSWPQGYEAQVRAGYLGNPVAQRAVKLVAESVGAAPFDAADEVKALVSTRLLGTVATQLLLHGDAFVQVLRGTGGEAVELFALRPERVSVEADAFGWPAAYLYRVGGKATRLTTAEVIHLRGYHPLDDHYGLGCLGAASAAIAVHNAATVWAKGLLDNAARPSGALVYDPGDGSALSAEQFRRLKAEMEAGFAGAANAGRPMLLEGGLKWQALSLTPADLDFAETKAAAAREIALAFGVPPMLLGLPGDSTHANYKEANRALWRLTVLPMAEWVLGELSRGLAAWTPEPAMTLDPDKVPALVEDRERLWRMVSAELRGAAAALDAPVAEETSPLCRAELGDRRCRVPMAGRRRFARVLSVDAAVLTLDASEPVAGAYAGGRLRWFAGANCGLEEAVASSSGTTVTLRLPPRFAHETGALVRIEEGCDRTIATCAGRFANAANFRGEPYLPGIDLLTRYPGG